MKVDRGLVVVVALIALVIATPVLADGNLPILSPIARVAMDVFTFRWLNG